MHKRHLGNTDLLVSPIGLGTVKFGRNEGVKYPTPFDLPDLDALDHLLGTAWDLGINLLDTAPAYGTSESRIGELIQRNPRDWLISTKVGEHFSGGESTYYFSATATRKSIENSLRQLKRETLDIVLVHSDGNDEAIIQNSEVIDTLIDLKREGHIRYIGFSGKTVEGSALAMDLVDIFMITLNLDDQSQLPLIELCKQYNKGVMIKKALASGHSTTPTEAMQYVLNTPGVNTAIVGTINPTHLMENTRALS